MVNVRLLWLASLAAMGWLATMDAPPDIALDQLPAHDGQIVRIDGRVQDPWIGTSAAFDLVADGRRIRVFADDLPAATWVQVEGRVRIADGAVDAMQVTAVLAPDPATPAWRHIAAAPDAWTDRWLRLWGVAGDGQFHAHGVHVAQGDGAWLDGRVEATGHIVYEPRCACYRFDADAVRTWK